LRVDYRKTADLKPSKHNSRSHSPAQIDEIRRSIEAVGWTKPIIVDEKDEILAGHGAHLAAQQMGLEEVPTILRAGLTSAQKRAYLIADNRLAEKSTWDLPVLALEFKALRDMGYDMSLTGFSQTEVDFHLKAPITDANDPPLPPLQTRVISKLGDVWQLGPHRIICGDSTKPDTYKALLEGRQAQCVFTDPPYGISYEAPSGAFQVIKGDDMRRGELKAMLRGAFGCAAANARADAGWYVWHASGTRNDFAEAIAEVGLVELCLIIWEKPGATLGWGDYRQAHEPCFYAAQQGVKPMFLGDRTGTTLWRLEGGAIEGEATVIGNGIIIADTNGQELYLSAKPPAGKKVRHLHLPEKGPLLLQGQSHTDDLWRVSRDAGHGKDAAIHPTMKPIELARRACRNSAKEGDIVLDMFGGGGSTLIGAEQTGRVACLSELDPHYVDATVRRWQQLTGNKATHAQSNKAFDDLERKKKAA
jgi:DNA modification methylase